MQRLKVNFFYFIHCIKNTSIEYKKKNIFAQVCVSITCVKGEEKKVSFPCVERFAWLEGVYTQQEKAISFGCQGIVGAAGSPQAGRLELSFGEILYPMEIKSIPECFGKQIPGIAALQCNWEQEFMERSGGGTCWGGLEGGGGRNFRQVEEDTATHAGGRS